MVQACITPFHHYTPSQHSCIHPGPLPIYSSVITSRKRACTIVQDFKYNVLSSIYNAYTSKRNSTYASDLCILFYQNVSSIIDWVGQRIVRLYRKGAWTIIILEEACMRKVDYTAFTEFLCASVKYTIPWGHCTQIPKDQFCFWHFSSLQF